ncbi:MAG TPA: methyltransferase domain-containing protein [bacterium]|nr:methyltransferase domain-containing protein [bacterium]HPN30079.1 methyltransferase domain-containing protein [bacterium]
MFVKKIYDSFIKIFFGELKPRIFAPAYFTGKSIIKWIETNGEKINSGIVIDLGCGQKTYKNLFIKNNSSIKYYGFDIPSISSSMHNIKAAADVQCNLEKIPVKNESVDAVYSSFAMQYIINPVSFFKSVCGMLKKNGKLFIIAPHISPITSDDYDYLRFTENFFRKILNENKFKKIEIEHCGNFAVTIITMVNKSLYHYIWSNSKKKAILKLLLTPVILLILLFNNLSGLILIRLKFNKNYYPTNLFIYAEK